MARDRTIAIVGAGLAGLACARALTDGGLRVSVFDKGRAPGGRLATRRAAGAVFDHGAPSLAAEDPAFRDWLDASPAATCLPSGEWIGVPGMRALVTPLTAGLPVETGSTVTAIARDPAGWHLSGTTGAEGRRFARLILAIPAPQAAVLCAGFPRIAQALARVRVNAIWAALATFDAPIPGLPDLLIPAEGPLARVERQSARPGRPATPEALVLHATPDWTAAHLERDAADVARLLLSALFDHLARAPQEPALLAAHRWRYARTATPLGRPFLTEGTLSLCGDWMLGPNAEHAFLSGTALAQSILTPA